MTGHNFSFYHWRVFGKLQDGRSFRDPLDGFLYTCISGYEGFSWRIVDSKDRMSPGVQTFDVYLNINEDGIPNVLEEIEESLWKADFLANRVSEIFKVLEDEGKLLRTKEEYCASKGHLEERLAKLRNDDNF